MKKGQRAAGVATSDDAGAGDLFFDNLGV